MCQFHYPIALVLSSMLPDVTFVMSSLSLQTCCECDASRPSLCCVYLLCSGMDGGRVSYTAVCIGHSKVQRCVLVYGLEEEDVLIVANSDVHCCALVVILN